MSVSRCIILFSLFLITGISSKAQETAFMKDADKAYKLGVSLYEEKQLLAARKAFERYLEEVKPPIKGENYYRVSNAKYFIAAVAVDLQQPDAEKLLLEYIRDYHETNLRRMAYFQLGKLYFQKSSYKESLSWLIKTEKSDLDNEQRIEYSYKLGYCYFVTNDFPKAKPLFRDIKSFQNKYAIDANYYYGYIEFSEGHYDAAQKSFEEVKDNPRYKVVAPYYLAQIYFMKQNYSKVIAYASPLVKDKNVKYYQELIHLLGQSYFYTQDYLQAEKYLQEYIDHNSKVKKEDIYQLAFAQYKLADYTKAITNFKQLYVVNDTIGQNALYALADCYVKTGRKEEARTAFGQASHSDYDLVIKENAAANYVKLSYELGENTEAVNAASLFLDAFPESSYNTEITQILTNSLLKTHNYKDAIAVIEHTKQRNAILNKAYQQVTYYKAVQEYNDDKAADAMSNLNKSLSNPLDKELQCDALFLKAELYFNQKKYSDAIIEYGKYLQITTPSEQYADEVNPFKARYGQAYCYLMAKQYGAAIPPLKDALNMSNHLKKNKSNSALINDVYFRLGDAYYMTKDFDNALSAYQHVLDNSDKNLDYALFQKGMILGFKNEDAAKVNILQNLISRYPESALADDALYEKGITYQQDLQDVESAISTFTALVNNYPNANHRAGALLRLGLINYNLNHADKALSYYQQAVKEFPKTDEAKEALSTMQEIYVSLGKPEQYVQYLNQNGLEVSASTQDSLYFNSAEEKYINGEYADAIPGLETYLSKFPNGYFHLEANYFAGDAYMRIKKYEDALKRFDAVIKEQPNTYAQRALKKAALISFEYLKDYSKSKEYYGMLYTYSIQKPEEFAMLMNALRSAYLAKADDDLLKYADLVIAHASAGKDDLLEAHYYKGSVLMDKNDIDKARLEFLEVSAGPTSEQNAEASYELAHILNLQGQFQPSNDEAFKMKDKVEGYDYWLAKLFILIGDNYHQLKDNYQAKATYESILNNYKGDATLIEECRKKLTELNNEALEKSKIELITAPSDSIIKTEEIK